MPGWQRSMIMVGEAEVGVVRGGQGSPLLVLHDELGWLGPLRWHERLSESRTLVMPLQPGYGDTPRIDWIGSHRDVAAFYARFLREQRLGPIDVVGFSTGGYIAAEMAAAAPELLRSLTLVAPLGVRPSDGEIFDFLAVTVRTQLEALASRQDGEYGRVLGGDITPERYERLEDARAESARIGWEPFMFDPSLPHRLAGSGHLPTLLVWGAEDRVCPRGCIDVYRRALPDARLAILPGVGHRPDLEASDDFVATLEAFLGSAVPVPA
ncbi:MAG: alpha/beta fold hydrolase [Actinomycetota bacterium]|jgi:pimeloyl-ACP methyl ester carboxylesterase